MKLYIESIEGGTYLTAVADQEKPNLVRDNAKKPKVFHCLNEIKEHLYDANFQQVWLKQNTPYDEMCGLDYKHEKLERLIEWQ